MKRCSGIFVFLLLVVCGGCKDSLSFVKEGAIFAATEKTPPDKALVYFYWPREEQGQWKHLWVGACDGWSEEILPEGYMARVVEPGSNCLQAESRSESKHGNALVSRPMGSLELKAEPGRTYFIRLGKEKKLFLISQAGLRLVKPEVANPEIRRCRRMMPLTLDELQRQFSGGKLP